MSSLSRTIARADGRGQKLMTQYQPGESRGKGPAGIPGQVTAANTRHRRNRIARLSRRRNRA